MRPLPRQKIYKISIIKSFFDFFTFGLFNYYKTNKLTHFLQKFFDEKKILCLNRGRLGAYLATKVSVTKNKKKVILSPFTIYDVINMVICAGAQPVFCDVEKSSITINMENILKVYDDEVAAILITHTHLMNSDILEIVKFCKSKDIILIEDCAISFGTKLNDQLIGTLGDVSFFSFGLFKFVSSLNGGLILATNKKIYDKILEEYVNFRGIDYTMIFKNFFKSIFITTLTNNFIFKFFSSFIIKYGQLHKINIINNFSKNDPNPQYLKKIPKNYKKIISPSQSAAILQQIPNYINDFKIRIDNAKIYYMNLKDINEIEIPYFDNNFCNGWINFPIMYKERDKLLNFLFENNRDLAIYFYRNCNDLNIFEKYKNKNLKVINEVINEIIILPTYPKYEKKQIMQNIILIKQFFNV
tara:strand:+ start:823 stop:2064 length:1242 start_codon:yes stop_codon:yes gene_type:complete